MMSVPITLTGGHSATFDIDLDLEGPAYFALSVRKCGSSLFNNICSALAKYNHCNFVDVGDRFFRANVPEATYLNDPALQTLLHPRNGYGGFRSMPTIFVQNRLFLNSPKLLMIRDPRDALVSNYFSVAHSHPIPLSDTGRTEVADFLKKNRARALEMGLESFVKDRARGMARTMLSYAPIMKDTQTTVLKYENYIFDKPSLISVIAQKFGWVADDTMIEQILSWADIRPQEEQPTAFVRKVTPGDHREKLSKQTISEITGTLQPAMELFEYQA